MTGAHPTGEGERPAPERGMGFERAVFFSDAVFAIAITLLVIDLRLPEAAEDAAGTDIATLLGEMLPGFLAFGLSFAVIGTFWMAHWRRYGHVLRVDGRLLWLNLLLLAFVALMPFPTAVISTHGDDPAAVVLYVAIVAAGGLAGTLGWIHAHRAGLLVPGLPREFVRLTALRGLVVPIVMVATLPLLAAGPYIVEWSWLLIIPAQLAVNRRIARVRDQQDVPLPA